ncbi:hypothetical protein [Campylobacter sp. MG1]|uniref:hypothetical protein n=1 Tax=Campylobacter sp. MG1 TaxID=2976332 RepID=UPI00226CEF0C|nr:hypothetical protein [Campylobacter sp. MG1]
MDFLDSLKQIKTDIVENEKLQAEKKRLEEIAQKEKALQDEFIDMMKDCGVKEIK